jgi:hypothetical protein
MASSAASAAHSAAALQVPLAATTPNSAAWPRRALIAWVRWLTSISRCLRMMVSAC